MIPAPIDAWNSTWNYSRYTWTVGGSADRRDLVKGFAAAERHHEQIVAVAPQLLTSRIPAQVRWGDAHTAFGGLAPLSWPLRQSGRLRRVTTVPHAKLFWPEVEPPRLLAMLLKEFWASANYSRAQTGPGGCVCALLTISRTRGLHSRREEVR